MIKNPIAFVSGSTGATGRAVVAQLANSGKWRVLALTRQPNRNKLELFPEIETGRLSKVTLMYEKDPEDWSKFDPIQMPRVDEIMAYFLCHGTSREYPDVNEDMDKDGQEGFKKWLQRIDVDMTRRIARRAVDTRAPIIVRLSASKADPECDPTEFGGFGLYFKFQGLADKALEDLFAAGPSSLPRFGQFVRRKGETRVLIFRPGSLDRGEELRKGRPWERDIAKTGARPTMPVGLLASAMIKEVNIHMQDRHSPQEFYLIGDSSFKIYPYEDVWELINDINANSAPPPPPPPPAAASSSSTAPAAASSSSAAPASGYSARP